MSSFSSFSQDITRFADKVGKRADDVLRYTAFECYGGLLEMAPVDTGFFRSNWFISINTPDLRTEPPTRYIGWIGDKKRKEPLGHPPGGISGAEKGYVAGKMNGMKFGMTIYITNNTTYGPQLERGWSKQAPAGFLTITATRVANNLRRRIEALK